MPAGLSAPVELWAPSVADFPEGRTFSDIVEIRARQQPDRTFARLVKRDGSREALTYGDLEAQSAPSLVRWLPEAWWPVTAC